MNTQIKNHFSIKVSQFSSKYKLTHALISSDIPVISQKLAAKMKETYKEIHMLNFYEGLPSGPYPKFVRSYSVVN